MDGAQGKSRKTTRVGKIIIARPRQNAEKEGGRRNSGQPPEVPFGAQQRAARKQLLKGLMGRKRIEDPIVEKEQPGKDQIERGSIIY